MFHKQKTEQKFTPIYSLQCKGRIEGFHKFLKATIAKQLETRVKWDDLMWKATAAYNFFPTESSGVAPFFLMFGHEAAVKYTLLESERLKFLGSDNGMINIELMTKLYHVVAHNLNEARKARDGKKKSKMPKEPERLKIGDNVLISDHTSKAFKPKYKDFCIIGLLGKNQIEIKDNHDHITKKIPMTEKVCQLYEEEQIGKVREGSKAVPNSEMPDLGWDIAETQLQENYKRIEVQENLENYNPHLTPPLQTIIAIASIIITILEHTKALIQEIPEITRKTVHALKSMTIKITNTEIIKNTQKMYDKIQQGLMEATRMTNHTNQDIHHE